MTSVIARSHMQAYVGGGEIDISPGSSFDASDLQIAILLPIGAIYPAGYVPPSPTGDTGGTTTTVIAKVHIEAFVGAAVVDIVPGQAFAATATQIAILLPIGAIYPLGTVLMPPVTPTAITISGSPPGGTVGTAYSFVPSTANGAGTKTFALTGTLSPGLTFSTSSGAIGGTPTAAGTASSLSITATDTTGSATLGPFSIVISAAASGGASAPGGGPNNTADHSDVNNAYLAALAA